MITLDTTRADALGAYGGPASPTFDALAARSARFAWAISHTTTTLNSHTSLFTGLDPHEHAVPRNGFTLPAELQTLASRLRNAGWDTIGVAGASALDSETGIDRGFRLYNDDLPNEVGPRYEAPGDDVTRRALEEVDKRLEERPLFLFVHYYDAHSPYEAPGTEVPFADPDQAMLELATKSRDGLVPDEEKAALRAMYQREVAYEDQQLGLLFDGLTERGLMGPETVVVVTADHGEMFFENAIRPVGHGPDVDLPVTHVPLVIAAPGLDPRVVEQPVKLSDVAPTVLELAGLPTLGTGQSLVPLLQGQALPTTPIYLEATRPYASEGPAWNNVPAERGLVDGDLVGIQGPSGRLHLYQLDPLQTRATNPERAKQMEAQLKAWDEAAPEYRPESMSDHMREALRSLGYLD